MPFQRVRLQAYKTLAVIALALALAVAAFPSIERIYLERASAAGENTLRIAVEGLSGSLERFQPMPGLIAERPILVDLLKDPDNEGLRPFVNEQLRLTAMSLGVSDVYLMDIGGNTIAASSYRKELSFVGRNFSFRPYFQQAIEGGLGRYFALGTTSGERGYFFASPVLDNTRILGVIAIKFTVDSFEEAWRGGASEILVTDLAGVVFMSSRPEWHFRTFGALGSREFARISRDRQYPLDRLIPFEIDRRTTGTLDRLTLDGETFVANEVPLATVGWRVLHLTPTAPARAQALLTLLGAVLLMLLTLLGWQIVNERRARAAERLEVQRQANERLERQVAKRTEALNTANARLTEEVEERKATEQRLRQTQRELIQAGKLAALGQMSAALSHEINQPLTAVKAYADNAATYLERDRIAEAADNVARISRMVDRMATLSGHLRNFARRPQDSVEPVDLSAIVGDALDLMEVRIAGVKARVDYTAPPAPVLVMGGRVRLQQVIVNLLSNALDAMQAVEEPVITIEIDHPAPDATRLLVTDIGSGLDEAVQDQIFDPFFTTKGPKKGLGLGLSISYNIVRDFGGSMAAANAPGGGAVFSVTLRSAETGDQTAVAAQ
ncbi:sensor histidine kinase [Kangsaoukella pontilimi]|uniref:sensor histidine kinase n=1 Tax=Kangsaoukella pontilimi TaxID=2691042 RepID=UPI0029CA1E4A|nr:ATP-binding protein [Kangsaoukella pontilimi]